MCFYYIDFFLSFCMFFFLSMNRHWKLENESNNNEDDSNHLADNNRNDNNNQGKTVKKQNHLLKIRQRLDLAEAADKVNQEKALNIDTHTW